MKAATAPVSVVIPFFDGHDTLARALRSLAAQSLVPAEVVLVDDGSPEPLRDEHVARAVGGGTKPAARSPEIRVVRHPENRGIPAARNTGVAAARNDWIAFLDQDDEWLPEKLARQWRRVEEVARPERTLIFAGCRFVAGDGAPVDLVPRSRSHRRLTAPGDALAELLLGGNGIPLIGALLHRELLDLVGGFDERVTGGADDYALALRLAAEGVRFVASDPAGHASTLHHLTGSNYSDPEKWIRDEAIYLPDLAARYPEVAALAGRARAASRYRAARFCHRVGELRAARGWYRESFGHRPWAPKAWMGVAATLLPRAAQQWIGATRAASASGSGWEDVARDQPSPADAVAAGTGTEPAVDVIVLSLDRPELTVAAVRSALDQAGVSVNVVVVDQGSEARTLDLLRDLAGADDRVRLIELGRNVGVPAGRNIGMRAGAAPFIASIDNDATFGHGDALARAVAHFDRDPSVAALSFRVVEARTGRIDESSWIHARASAEATDEPFFTGVFVGAGHALRRTAVEAVGGYDDDLFFLWEERDLALRLVGSGYRVLYCPDVTVRHAVASERRVRWGEDRYYYLVRNSLRLQCRYWGPGPGMVARVFGYAVRGLVNGVPIQTLRGLWAGGRYCVRGREDRYSRLSPVGRRYLGLHEGPYRGSLASRVLDQVMWRKGD